MKKEIGTHPAYRKKLSPAQRAADSLTKWVGSWTFIICFLVFLIIYILINTYFLTKYYQKAFDPYPFILLNLILACITAAQVPVILMSQNREAHRDRLRTQYDYQINKKAEQEIREIKAIVSRIEKRR